MKLRLGAMALGVVLVAGSVGAIWWSARISKTHTGFGAVIEGNQPGPFDISRLFRGHQSLEPRIGVLALRPGFARELRADMDLLVHVVDGLDRSRSRYGGISIWEDIHRTGWWGPTRERAEYSLLLSERQLTMGYRISVPFAEYAEVFREQLRDAPRQPTPGSILDELLRTHGQAVRSRVLWWGYAVNVATVVGVPLFVWGAWGTVGAITAKRRVKAGHCARCRYDLRGLGEGVMVCPECGAGRGE